MEIYLDRSENDHPPTQDTATGYFCVTSLKDHSTITQHNKGTLIKPQITSSHNPHFKPEIQ